MLEPNFQGLDPSTATYYIYHLGQVTLPVPQTPTLQNEQQQLVGCGELSISYKACKIT